MQKKIIKRKGKANNEFKKILLEEEVLKKQIKKLFYKRDKENLIEKYKQLSKELIFFKYNFFNLKKCILFNQDIIRKSSIFLCNVDYSIQFVKNNYLYNQLNIMNIDKITDKKLEKKLIKIKNNLKK